MTLNWRYNNKGRFSSQALILLLFCCPLVIAERLVSLGPYSSEGDLARVIAFLDGNGIPFESNLDALTESLGFIAVTEQLTPEAASSTIGELLDQGVNDLLYIGAGVYKNRISAGVFATKENADNRVASLSAYGFRVLERRRILSSSSITVVRADIPASLREKFQTATGVQIAPVTVLKSVDAEEKSQQPIEPPAVMPTEKPSQSSTPALEERKPAPSNKVISIRPSTKYTFPFVPFLLIALSLMIIAVLGYYYFSRRSAQTGSVRHAVVEAPQTTQIYQQVIPQAERQLDGSVSAISEYANQLLAGQMPSTEEVPRYIATIRSGGIEVLDLISDIIDLSRIELGQAEIERISFDPESALQDLVKSLSPRAEQKGISLHFEPDETLPGLVASDPAKLEKILSTITAYAIENTDSGRVLITAGSPDQLDSLRITIKHTTDDTDPLMISEMFGPVESTSGINSEQRLKFAVSKRLASLMGGGIQVVSQSDHDIEYVVTVQADEILKKQLLLPSGVSIDELIESESKARKLAENARDAIEVARTHAEDAMRAQSEAESNLARETEAKTSAEERAKASARARSEAESIAAKLTIEKENIEIEIAQRKSALAEASSRLESLSLQLETAQSTAEDAAQANNLLEKETREKIQHITAELSETRDRLQIEIESRSETEASANEKISELDAALSDAQARLKQELVLHSDTDIESRSRIESLQRQLNETKSASVQESTNAAALERRLTQVSLELEETHKATQSELSVSQQQIADTRLHVEKLTGELEKTQAIAAQMTKERDEHAEKSKRLIEALQLELGIAQQQAVEEAKQRIDSRDESSRELNRLRHELANAQASLDNGQAIQHEASDKLQQQVDSLQTALTHAEEKLTGETEFRNRVEQHSGNQIESLINEVNQARAGIRQEAEARLRLEKETERQIDAMSSELEEAHRELEAEARTRIELGRVNEFARETSRLLDEAQAKTRQVKVDKEAAEHLVAASQEALARATADADRNARAAEAARQELEHLITTSGAASINPGITDPGTTSSREVRHTEDDDTPIYSSKEMGNPILRSMVERFIVRLSQHLDTMETSLARQEYLDLVVIANWIKSEAFNLGFSQFEPPVTTLELCLRQQDFTSIPDVISQLRRLDQRIEIQDLPVDDGSSLGVKPKRFEDIRIPLPVGGKKAELLENFVSQLGLKLLEMQSAWDEGNVRELEKVCKWISRYGKRLHLDLVMKATEELESALGHADADRISQKLWNFIGLYSHIELERKL
jgi:Histidine kinase-, DNA gyrase B-, and HSP90-like ATPase